MSLQTRAFLGSVAMLLALASPAAATKVLVVKGDRTTVGDDPHLPAELAPVVPERTGARPRAVAAGAPTVQEALREALREGDLEAGDYRRHSRSYRRARALVGRLSGARRAELASVVATLEDIARRRELTASRMPALFLQLRRNAQYWPSRPFPGSGPEAAVPSRVTFGGDPLVFQYYAGRGLQIQPLANFGKANALYSACAGADPVPAPEPGAGDEEQGGQGVPCEREELRTLVDQLVAIASRRGDFTAWEYFFRFGGGAPPWTSGLSQGTAIQALARAYELFRDVRYLRAARRALRAFERRPPVGVRIPASGGSHYLIYSFAPRLLVLNAFLQAVIGLHDYTQLEPNARWAARGRLLFERGDRAARRSVPAYDTGAWSLYSLGGAESDIGYHRLVRDFLRGLCERTAAEPYCGTAERFHGYLLEDPVVTLAGAAGAREGEPAQVRFTLSKASSVELRIFREDQLVHSQTSRFAYGSRFFEWTPRAAGEHAVTLTATSFRNKRGTATGLVSVGEAE